MLIQGVPSKVGLVVLLLGLFACDRSSSGGAGPSSQSTTSPQAIGGLPPATATTTTESDIAGAAPSFDVSNLGDPGLAAVLISLHQRIGQEAQLAATAGMAREVKEQAHETAMFHSDLITSYRGLFQRLTLVPRDNLVSRQIDADAANALQTLRRARAATFDSDYLEWQSRSLREALQLFEGMIPAATNPDLQAEIARHRTAVQAQLQTVSRLQETLNPGVTNRQAPSPPYPRPMP
jgi:hypothetical protein